MELGPYVDHLRQQLLVAAAAGDEATHAVAEQLAASLDAATRLVLLEALSDAASQITSELAPASVDVRLRGRDPEFVVSAPALEPADPAAHAARRQGDVADDGAPTAEADESGTARITLRLSEHLKGRVEAAAGRSGHSVNAWLVREIAQAVEAASPGHPPTRRVASGGEHVTGWAR